MAFRTHGLLKDAAYLLPNPTTPPSLPQEALGELPIAPKDLCLSILGVSEGFLHSSQITLMFCFQNCNILGPR